MAEKGFLKTETNFTTYLNELKDAKPDIIYAPIYYNAMIPIARQAKAVGLTGDMFVGGDGWDADALLDGRRRRARGRLLHRPLRARRPLAELAGVRQGLQGALQARPRGIAAMGYDAAKLLADAIGRAKGDTPEAIRDAIANTKGFQGATGTITINAERNADKPIVVVQIKGKKFTYHSTVDPRAAR